MKYKYKPRTKPRKYQNEGAFQIEKFDGRALLADEMGLGKTFQALLWLSRNPHIRTTIVVCPKSLKWNWAREASIHFGMRAKVLEGSRIPDTSSMFKLHDRLIVINFDILKHWVKYLKKLRPGLVIVDECQGISNLETQRTRAVVALCRRVKHVIMISGTPMLEKPVQMFTALHVLRKDLFPSFRKYANRYCKPRLQRWGWTFNGATNTRQLNRRLLRSVMIRRLKKDVLKELPKKQVSVVPLDIDKRKEYIKAQKDLVKWLLHTSPDKARSAKKALELVKIGYLKRLAASLKMKNVIEWIDTFLETSGEKILIFGIHNDIIEQLRKNYEKKCVVIDGSTPIKQRQHNVEIFQRDKKVSVFIGNIRAAGVGLTLTAASTVVFVELDYVPGIHTQAADRAHRIGQTKDVKVYYLVARDTIEEKLCEKLQKKQKVFDMILDGKEVNTSMNVYDQLLKELMRM